MVRIFVSIQKSFYSNLSGTNNFNALKYYHKIMLSKLYVLFAKIYEIF